MSEREPSLTTIFRDLERWLRYRNISTNATFRLPTHQDGLILSDYLMKEQDWDKAKPTLRPVLSWVQIAGIRIVWPMPELDPKKEK